MKKRCHVEGNKIQKEKENVLFLLSITIFFTKTMPSNNIFCTSEK